LRIFEPSDLAEINRWYVDRGFAPIELANLPKFGLIEPGVTAGFLYQTDSDFAILEGFISNPESDQKARDESLDIITEALTEMARNLGFAKVLAITSNLKIENRAMKHNFSPLGDFKMLKKEL
jgi:sugar phosphate isomerase/epimerase